MSADALAALQDATFAASPVATASSYPPSRRLSGETLVSVLTTRRYATLSTTRPDGRPHAAPTSFVLSGTAVWLPTVEGAVRLRNVATHPYAVLVLSEGERGAHVAIIAEGPVTVSPSVPAEVEADVVAQLEGVPDWVGAWIVLAPFAAAVVRGGVDGPRRGGRRAVRVGWWAGAGSNRRPSAFQADARTS